MLKCQKMQQTIKKTHVKVHTEVTLTEVANSVSVSLSTRTCHMGHGLFPIHDIDCCVVRIGSHS